MCDAVALNAVTGKKQFQFSMCIILDWIKIMIVGMVTIVCKQHHKKKIQRKLPTYETVSIFIFCARDGDDDDDENAVFKL